MSNPQQLVQKLWNYCHIGSLAPARSGVRPFAPQNPFRSPPGGSSLRDDGLSYGAYVEELTFLLLLKMRDEKASAPYLAEIQWRDAAATGPEEGMRGIIFRKTQSKIRRRVI